MSRFESVIAGYMQSAVCISGEVYCHLPAATYKTAFSLQIRLRKCVYLPKHLRAAKSLFNIKPLTFRRLVVECGKRFQIDVSLLDSAYCCFEIIIIVIFKIITKGIVKIFCVGVTNGKQI